MQELNEAVVRDRQAFGYLKHKKHSVHIDLITKFLANIPPGGGAVLDLGCGPGPTTKLLAGKGFSVTAVDFSPESLRLNAESCAELSPPPTFVSPSYICLPLLHLSAPICGRGSRNGT